MVVFRSWGVAMGRFLLSVKVFLLAIIVVAAASILSFAFGRFSEESHRKRDVESAKRDATSAAFDSLAFPHIKSIQKRLEAVECETYELTKSANVLVIVLSHRVNALEQRIAELENANASGEGNRGDSPSGE